ncbi:MAG: galactose ABC transporter substrate-binding protein [Clostridium sp.]|uniref:galactose ABC transporter substrate-binding protein n=1 Tax=Clostridium sp. TaxID=1506 RepID=UPI003F317A47
MIKVKKVLAMAMATLMIGGALVGCGSSGDKKEGGDSGKPVKIGVCLYKFDDTYISTVRQSLEKIQKDNEGKVEFTFYDGKGDQATQNDSIDTLLEKETDLLMVNLVDTGAAPTVIKKVQDAEVPVVLFNREPAIDAIKAYDKAMFVGTNAKEAGVLQGKILSDAWKANKELDKNGDGVMQYVMLKGEPDNPEAMARTEFSVSTIEEAGIKTKELANQVCNWQQDLAQNAMEAWFARYGKDIEVVIANNDGMAQGAVTALQAQGYNNGDEKKTIPVVGVDATSAAQDLISKGFMAGSVLQDAPAMAEALYKCGMNLANGKSGIDGTDYKFDDSGVAVRIPYQEYTNKK